MKKGIDSDEVLTRLFGSISRARILGFLYAHTGQSFYQREIMHETGLSLRPVQRELDNLVDLGILKRRETYNRVFYEVDSDSIFFKPLMQICGEMQKEKL
jgi:DNA-binding MarR family transcriptional regulator